MPAAARLAADLDHPVYDCFYLALAPQVHQPVATAERRFRDTVRAPPISPTASSTSPTSPDVATAWLPRPNIRSLAANLKPR